jgi:hypothetical protein
VRKTAYLFSPFNGRTISNPQKLGYKNAKNVPLNPIAENKNV